MTKPRIQQAVRTTRRNSTRKAKRPALEYGGQCRPEEMLQRIEDKDLFVRQLASVVLVRISEQYPERLIGGMESIKHALNDDSAYVRWHAVYILGTMMSFSLTRTAAFLGDLVFRLDDDNRIVREFARRALRQIAGENPSAVEELFRKMQLKIPPSLGPILSS